LALQVIDTTVYFGEAFIKVLEESCPEAVELLIQFGVDIVVGHNWIQYEPDDAGRSRVNAALKSDQIRG
jgi:hypothetical protein